MKEFANLTLAVEAKALTTLRTGIGQYVFGLYKAINAKQNKPTINYFINKTFTQDLPEIVSNYKNNKDVKLKAHFIKLLNGVDNKLAYVKKTIATIAYNSLFNHQLKKLNVNIIHCTDFFCIGNKLGIPEFITVYDISCFKYPETHPSARVKLFNKLLPDSLEKSQHIITISEFSKNELVNYFGINPEKITVTYCGLPSQFNYIHAQNITATLKLYGLNYKKYFLYVGTIEPRKNLNMLLEVYQAMPDTVKQQYKLVVIGALGWKFEHFIQKAKTLLINNQLLMPGYVPEHQLSQLMSGAFCFLYPSLYEGFGIPPLEAMASRVPVIASNRASLPEVIDGAGILLPPDDVLQWKEAIESLIDDHKRYQYYVKQGLQRSALFTWEACADKTLQCFQKYRYGD
jgi:alpha-1,3-rhamnosyl/mannosyltransferase